MGFSFVRRCVSSPEIIPIKPRRRVAVTGSVSIARAAMHRRSKAHADPFCPKEEGATNTHSVHRLARPCVLAPGAAPPRAHRSYLFAYAITRRVTVEMGPLGV